VDLLTPIEVAASRGDIAIGVFIWGVLSHGTIRDLWIFVRFPPQGTYVIPNIPRSALVVNHAPPSVNAQNPYPI
jgi:hypothetical protein